MGHLVLKSLWSVLLSGQTRLLISSCLLISPHLNIDSESMSFRQYILIIIISWSIWKTQKHLISQKKTAFMQLKKEAFMKRKSGCIFLHGPIRGNVKGKSQGHFLCNQLSQKNIHIKQPSLCTISIIYRSRTTHSIDSTSSKSSLAFPKI